MALADYISSTFPQIKSQLAWVDSVAIATIVAAALEKYGVSAEIDATDTKKLHALANVAVWQQALNDLSLDYAFAADNASYQRQQAVEAVRKNLQAAEGDAAAYLPGYQIVVHPDATNSDWFE